MASALYPAFKEALLNKEHDLDTDLISVILVSTSDETYNSADTVLTDITGGPYGSSTKQDITATTITGGVFNGGNLTFPSVAVDAGKVVDTLVIYNDSTVTDQLIAWIDVTASSVTPNGGDITVTWDTNIFAL